MMSLLRPMSRNSLTSLFTQYEEAEFLEHITMRNFESESSLVISSFSSPAPKSEPSLTTGLRYREFMNSF